MSIQERFQKKKEKEQSASKQAKAALDAIKEQKVAPKTRTVKVRFHSCCGCGCDDDWYLREVPYDSPLQNGDEIKKVLDSDKWVG